MGGPPYACAECCLLYLWRMCVTHPYDACLTAPTQTPATALDTIWACTPFWCASQPASQPVVLACPARCCCCCPCCSGAFVGRNAGCSGLHGTPHCRALLVV